MSPSENKVIIIIIIIIYPLPKLFKFSPGGENWPRPWGHSLTLNGVWLWPFDLFLRWVIHGPLGPLVKYMNNSNVPFLYIKKTTWLP